MAHLQGKRRAAACWSRRFGDVDASAPAAVHVFARYQKCRHVVADGARLQRRGGHAWTEGVVEVYPDLTTHEVVIRAVTSM